MIIMYVQNPISDAQRFGHRSESMSGAVVAMARDVGKPSVSASGAEVQRETGRTPGILRSELRRSA